LYYDHQDEWVDEVAGLPHGREPYYSEMKRMRWLNLARPPRDLRVPDYDLKRGMVGAVSCTAAFFWRYAAAMFAVAPIEAIHFARLSVRNTARLARVAEWPRVRRLALSPNRMSADAAVAALQVEPLRSVPVLSFAAARLDPAADAWHEQWAVVAETVASDPRSAGLRGLNFAGSGIGNEGGMALADSPYLTGLSWINLQNNPLDDGTRARLRERFGRRLIIDPADRAGFRYRDLF
jgi:hypothetical protein